MWSGRDGRRMPASASVFAVKSFVVTWVLTLSRSRSIGRIVSRGRQLHARRCLALVDQRPDLARAARVEEDVALADGRLLGQQAGLQERLSHRLRERPLVAGEAAREVREVGVVAAPLAHAVEPLEDAAGGPARRGGVLLRPGGARAAGREA